MLNMYFQFSKDEELLIFQDGEFRGKVKKEVSKSILDSQNYFTAFSPSLSLAVSSLISKADARKKLNSLIGMTLNLYVQKNILKERLVESGWKFKEYQNIGEMNFLNSKVKGLVSFL
jgi:hypothetical protein